MIFAFSLRQIRFHLDNYSFQFYADNNSRCYSQVYFDLFGVFLQFIYSINHGKLSLGITKIFRGCEASSEDVNKKITITQWTKTFEAVISTVTCFQDKFNGKYIDL